MFSLFASLAQIIEKEERQLRAPKPRIEVDHIWDSRTLTGRPSSWKEITSRKNPDNIMEMTRSKLGMSVPQLEDNEIRRSRSTMLADRRTQDSLDAMMREKANDAKSSEAGFKSAASLFTPDELKGLKPTYAPNERLATESTNAVIGLGSRTGKVPLQMSRYARQRAFPPDFTQCRNNPDRTLVEASALEATMRPKPWKKDPPPSVPEMPASHIFPRDPMSSFSVRPGSFPLADPRSSWK